MHWRAARRAPLISVSAVSTSERIIHPGRAQELDFGAPDRPGRRLGAGKIGHLGDACQAEEFGAAPFHETQVICVVDHAGQIRIFVIDPDGQDMRLAFQKMTQSPIFPR